MNAELLTLLGLAFVFIVTGANNLARGRGPWRAFLWGGIAMALWVGLHLLRVVQ